MISCKETVLSQSNRPHFPDTNSQYHLCRTFAIQRCVTPGSLYKHSGYVLLNDREYAFVEFIFESGSEKKTLSKGKEYDETFDNHHYYTNTQEKSLIDAIRKVLKCYHVVSYCIFHLLRNDILYEL